MCMILRGYDRFHIVLYFFDVFSVKLNLPELSLFCG